METFKALVVDKIEQDVTLEIRILEQKNLPEGEVIIRVRYSSVNYKDGLACIPNGGIVRNYPFVPGIDLAGVVEASEDPRYQKGDEVLITGFDLGVSHFGGFSEYARVPADWIVPLPDGLSLKEVMAIGTAGFTAAISIERLEENGMRPDKGPVLVTGASGGVGSSAVAILHKLGYEVHASTRSSEASEYLQKIGAKEILSPEDLANPKNKALLKQKWQAAIDPVAGKYLPVILASLQYGGSVALSGLTAGNRFEATVYPFILRGVNMLGIDSVFYPMEKRKNLWKRLAGEMKPDSLIENMVQEITMDELPAALAKILKGKTRGRIVVSM